MSNQQGQAVKRFAIRDHVIIDCEGHIWDGMDGWVMGIEGEEVSIALTPPSYNITEIAIDYVFPYPNDAEDDDEVVE